MKIHKNTAISISPGAFMFYESMLENTLKALLWLFICVVGLSYAHASVAQDSPTVALVSGSSDEVSAALETDRRDEYYVALSQLAQAPAALSQPVTLHLRSATLGQALRRVSEETGLEFVYGKQVAGERVSVHLESVPAHEALREILRGTGRELMLSSGGQLVLVNQGAANDSPKMKARGADFRMKPVEIQAAGKAPLRSKRQQGTITGTVTDSLSGEPIPGVNVVVVGTQQGSATGAEGQYTISGVEPGTHALRASFVGYSAKTIEGVEVVEGETTEVNFQLLESAIALEEVVAVGYGQEQRGNITGSVSSIDGESLRNIPVTEASQALAGQASGVSVRQTSGAPGKGGANIRVRGFGTFSSAGNEPLVIVDGIPSSLDNVDPNDIESISVLKDAASAAIYGSRAANGVILVETVRGSGEEMSVSYNAYVGQQQMAEQPEFVDSWIYAQARNEAARNMGQGSVYSEEDIEKYRAQDDPYYPNVDHYDRFFNSGNGLQTNHNLSFTGGSANNRYSAALGYLQQDGLVRENVYRRYNLRLNLDSDVTDRFQLRMNLRGNVSNRHEPGAFTGDGTLERLVTRITRQNATQATQYPDGQYSHIDRGAPWAALDSENFNQRNGAHVVGNVDLTYNLLNSLELVARGGYEFNNAKGKQYKSRFRVSETLMQEPSQLSINSNNDNTLTLEGLLRYSKTLQEHDVQLLGGYSQVRSRDEWMYAFRDNFPNNQLYELQAASSSNMQNNSAASEWVLQSFFGRAQYNFDDRYLFEANLRYDGSSRFRPGRRYGLFPSFSVGWRASNERFVSESLPWIDDLKLRGSWGELGNQQVGPYPYYSVVNMGQNYVFGDDIATGAAITSLANEDISWETTRMTDVGVDLAVLDGRLSLTTDYFHKITEDILYPLTVADVLGMGGSVQNAGEVLNTGWEFGLDFRNATGDFFYSVSSNFSVVDTEVLKIANTERDIGQGLFVGEPLNAIYGYVDDGLFVDEEDIQNYPDQPYSPEPGDIRYKDISGPDGVPDGRVDPEYDRTVIGQTEPKYTYSAQLQTSFRNLDFTFQLQGAAGMRRAPEHYAARGFANGSNVQQWMWENRWTPENPDRDAIYPRFIIHGEGRNEPYAWPSTYWFWDASYLRIKMVQLGYDFSSMFPSLNVDNLRLYVTGRNLFTFDNFVPGWDPEMGVYSAGGGKHYPLTRVINAGINVQF